MHQLIKFAKRPRFDSHGRNGFIHTTGVEVMLCSFDPSLLAQIEEDSCVTLRPITSKGVVSEACRLSIPLCALPEVIRALQEIVDQGETE